MNFFRIVFQFCFLILIFWTFIFFKTTTYLSEQLYGQVQLISSSTPIERLLVSESFTGDEKEKLEWIKKVLLFAESDLGLETHHSYQKMVNPHKWPLIMMVNVAEPFALINQQYQFPPFFTFPYLGFFNFSKANEEMKNKLAEGFDVGYGYASGWSMLGIIPDPVFRPWLKESKPKLAELIFHELTHANIYFRDSSGFNENVASFIGRQATRVFLDQQADKDTLNETYREQINYEDALESFVAHQSKMLNRFYSEISALPLKEKLAEKEKRFDAVILDLFKIAALNPKQKAKLAGKIRLQKNAFFTSFDSYRSDNLFLSELFLKDCRGHLPLFISRMKAMVAE